jgi:AcrR family transcriptional regulator
MAKDDGESVRTRLLAAAAKLFYRDGIHATGIDAILAEARVARRSLYQHFGSKDGLIAAFLEQRDREWRDWFDRTVAAVAATPATRLTRLFDVLETWFRLPGFHGCAFINAAAETGDPRHAIRAAAGRHKGLVRARIEEWARAAGADDPARLAGELALLAEGAIVTAMLDPDQPAAKTAKTLARLAVERALPPPASATA